MRNGFSKSRISETNFTSLAFRYDAKMLHAMRAVAGLKLRRNENCDVDGQNDETIKRLTLVSSG